MIVNQIAMVFGFLRWRFKHPRLLVKAYTLFFVAWTVFWILVVTAYLSTNPLNMVPLSLLLADLVIISIFILPPFPPLYYYWKSSRILATPPTIVKKGEVLERDTLFDDWKQFITLYPEEKLVHAYRDVNALYHADEIKSAREGVVTIHKGDLVLTNRRLAYLEYRYEEVPLTPKMKLMKILAILLLMVTIVACIASVFLPLIPLTLPIVLICLFLLSRISKRLPALPPIGYREIEFEIFLEKIVEIKRDSSLKGFLEIGVMHRKEPILVRFRNAQEENEFRKNLSYLVYEAQHHPKEVVQYSVVTRFDLGKDGTLSVSCPYCGASAPLRSKESEVTCKYCGKQYIIPKKILDLIG